jgi:hypothetical protein
MLQSYYRDDKSVGKATISAMTDDESSVVRHRMRSFFPAHERRKLVLSDTQLTRLNKIHQRFLRDDEYQLAHMNQMSSRSTAAA